MGYAEVFENEISEIYKLIDTPETVKDFAISQIKTLQNLEAVQKNQLAVQKFNQAITSFENIQSIEQNYRIIYSQICILIVSALEANLKKIFEEKINTNPTLVGEKFLEEIKITLNSLAEYNFDITEKVGTILLERAQGLNFQDLKSIKRNFKDYTKTDIKMGDQPEKRLCFFLESRHILVHKNGIVDSKFIKNTESFNSNIKNYKIGDRISLEKDDIDTLKCVSVELIRQIK